MFQSTIDPSVLAAYRETEYRVLGATGFTLLIGQVSEELLRLYARQGVECAAFLTAWNPYSEAIDAATNRRRQDSLALDLESLGVVVMPGVGQHPSGHWPGEDSFLVLGMNVEQAKALGHRYEQNALVWIGKDAVPALIMLR